MNFVTEKKENRRANIVAFWGNSLSQTQKTTNLFLALFLGYIFSLPDTALISI